MRERERGGGRHWSCGEKENIYYLSWSNIPGISLLLPLALKVMMKH